MLRNLRDRMIAGDEDVRKGLVVAQHDVVARHEVLDQIAFEQQRLDLGMGRDDLQAAGLGDHPP